jgi:hypothetical protein
LIEKYGLSAEQADVLLGKIYEINQALSIQEKAVGLVADFSEKNGYQNLADGADAYKTSLYKLLVQEQTFVAKNKDATDSLVINSKARIAELNKLILAIAKYQTTLGPVTDGEVKQIETLDTMNAKLKELNGQFEALDVNNKKELSNIGQQIIALKQLIEQLEKLRQERESFARGPGSALTPGSTPTGGTDQFTTTNVNKGIKEIVPLSSEEMTKRVFENLKNLRLVNTTTTEQIKGEWIDLSSSISGSISDIAFSFGQASQGVGTFGDGIIKALIGFAKQIGEILIATGTAMLAAKALIKNPATAIAAGVALVAIAGAASARFSAAQSGFNSGGGGSSRGQLQAVDRRGGIQQQELKVSGQFTVLGDDLVYIFDRAMQKNSRTRKS